MTKYLSSCCQAELIEDYKADPKDHTDVVEIYTCAKCGEECEGEYIGIDWEKEIMKQSFELGKLTSEETRTFFPIIQKLLAQKEAEKQAIVEEMLEISDVKIKRKSKLTTNEQTWYMIDGYNQAISDIISSLRLIAEKHNIKIKE